MRKPTKEIKLASYEDIIGAGSDVSSSEAITEVELSELYEFKDHPFRVSDDEKMEETVESVKKYGVLMPAIVRPRESGGYEIISGHRRKRACEIAGMDTMPVFVRNYSDDEATIIMVDSNIQREDILPSEKARAYRMKYEAMKHQGSRAGGKTLEAIGDDSGESAKTVQRFIYLSRLNDDLLELVDSRKLQFLSGVEISFLSTEDQDMVAEEMEALECGISTSQAVKIREYGEKGELTNAVIQLILQDDKPKTRKFTIKSDRLSEYFSEDVSNEEIEETIYRLLDEWKEKGGIG